MNRKIKIMEKKGTVVMNLDIAATQFETLNGVFFGGVIDAFSDNWNQTSILNSLFHRPFIRGIRELALYYTGETPKTYDEIKKEVEKEGLSFIIVPHLSLLVSAMRYLSKEKMTELGIKGKEIVLTSNEPCKVKDADCFFSIKTLHDVRLLSSSDIAKKQESILILVEKKK